MFNRQDRTLLSSSSSCRENVSNLHRVKAVGCMAGVFHLISKYHRRRKFLTSGSKRQSDEGNYGIKNNNNSSAGKQLKTSHRRKMKQTEIIKKLPPAVNNTEHREVVDDDDDDDDEKGRTLMEALRKCDEDLRKIQKVLEEARAARSLSSPEYKEGGRQQAEQRRRRRPTSFTTTTCKTPNNNNTTSFWHAQHSHDERMLMKMMSIRDHVDEQNRILNAAETSLLINTPRHKDRKCEATPPRLILLLRWSDRVVKESVEETGIDMRCEQKREFDKVGLALQECIYSDLIEELINVSESENERTSPCCNVTTKNQLSHHLCKRSLRF